MQPMNIPVGAQIMLGAPAEPMPASQSQAIAHAVAEVEGILEAHLPQCYVAEVMPQPAQILVLVLRSPEDAGKVLREISERLPTCLTEGATLDLWPIEPAHPILGEVRGADCQIYAADLPASCKPWWKFWACG
ncbi:MAG: hypothetical protein P8K78_08715 [Pirellulales bacterium]|nr:hypothetical protein [Pirellulales bacterium]